MPILTISNDFFTAAIDTDGAQLVSLKRAADDQEFIWQRDPEYWASSAPICFPTVGKLQGGGYEHEGKWFNIAKHGCVRYLPFFKARHTNNAVALSVCSNTATKKSFPFSFKLTITFALDADGLRVSYLVENMNEKTMPMSLGYHPAFALNQANPLSDYEIHFSTAEKLDLYGINEDGFILREKGYLKKQSPICLSDTIFNDDALIFRNIKSDTISIKQRDSDWCLKVKTGGAPHLALWSKPGAPFVCVEPWYICPDAPDAPKELSEKTDIMLLEAGSSFKSGYKIEPC